MTRWFWAAPAALVVIAGGWIFWQTGYRTTVAPPVAQSPLVAPAVPTAAQAPKSNAIAPSAEKEPVATPSAPTVAQTPSTNAAVPAAEKEPAAAPSAPTVSQVPSTNAAVPAAEKEPTAAPSAPTVAQVPAPNAAARTAEKEPAPAAPTVAQVPASNAAVQTAEKEPAPAPPAAVAQAPTTNASENEAATKPDAAASRATAKATAELASLKPGSGMKDLVAALNGSVINFGSNSAELPASTASFLQSAADDLKQMPAGHKLEIAGYTDNTGNERMNLALSQRRADAVREALVKSGVSADMLVAKGYGSADPIASNDTPEGRLRNRRIEYRVLKDPDKQ